jgi:hypothetical protein
MGEPIDNKIKKELQEHLVRTVQVIKTHDGWNLINIPELSQRELMEIAGQNGLAEDEQTRSFCKFISIACNFASLDFRNRLQSIPGMVNNIKELIVKMEEEIKEYCDIAICFHNIIQSFVKIVMNTKHNMNMALPHLEESIVHMKIMAEALMPNQEESLNEQDMLDVDLALSNLSCGIANLQYHARASKEESVQLDYKINNLKENIESNITVVENRIGFSKLLPKIGASLGMVSGAGAVSGAVESVAFGGAGTLLLGGFSFPPIGAILLGAAVGAIGIGSLLLLIIKLWEKHQFKALGYLREILDKLNKLNSANLAFMDYMNKSEEEANKILTNIEFFKRNVKASSKRYRKTNAEVCVKAIRSTTDMIECINEIAQMDMRQWIGDNEVPKLSMLGSEIENSILDQ